MIVPISEFRRQLRTFIDAVRTGEEVVVTERGVPVARVIGADATALLERLVLDGAISSANVGSRPSLGRHDRVEAQDSVSELVSQQRR